MEYLELKRLKELWETENPTENEKTEFFELVTKYNFIDLFEFEKMKCFVITYRYLNRTDASLHSEKIHALDTEEAINKLHAKHNNIEWHTVRDC